LEQIAINKRGATLRLSEAELRLLKNTLNEVTNGVRINEVEFQTRLNGSRTDVRQLLTEVGGTYRTWRDGDDQSRDIGGAGAIGPASGKAYFDELD
jgi:hypothetical protein